MARPDSLSVQVTAASLIPIQSPQPGQVLVRRHFSSLPFFPDAGTTKSGRNVGCVARTIVLLLPSLTTWSLDRGPRRVWRNWVGAGPVCVLDPDPACLPHGQGALEGAGGPQGTLGGGEPEGHVSPAPGGCSTSQGDQRNLLCLEMGDPFASGRLASWASS